MDAESWPARWERLGEAALVSTRILDLQTKRFRHPRRGDDREFYVLKAPDWVNVLALTPGGELVMVRQFRFGIEDFTWEVPGGAVDPDEAPVVAGLRELREETGYAGATARLLGTVHPNPAIQGNRCHIVLVEDAVPSAATAWDADEEIEVRSWPVAAVLEKARAGLITHALVLNALFLFEPFWKNRDAGGSTA